MGRERKTLLLGKQRSTAALVRHVPHTAGQALRNATLAQGQRRVPQTAGRPGADPKADKGANGRN